MAYSIKATGDLPYKFATGWVLKIDLMVMSCLGCDILSFEFCKSRKRALSFLRKDICSPFHKTFNHPT